MKHIHLSDCDSTQDVLKEQLNQSENEEKLLISAEKQLRGRGRGENNWLSMPGTLCFSFNINAHLIPSFTALELSVLVARFFEDKGQKLLVKWPNDLWTVDGSKCCGILIQNLQSTLLAGMGLNLFSNEESFSGIYETEFEIDKKSWCFDITKFIHTHRYDSTQALVKDWEVRCFHMNKKVTITEAGVVSEGIFKGLGEYGEAIIKTSSGEERHFNGSLRLIS
jgi:BirA family transcriptional regulator, biotin operon repressor / biotin---[acetyl-CoA-carboxylase] ligase